MVLDAGSVWYHRPVWVEANPGVPYQTVFFTLPTNPDDTPALDELPIFHSLSGGGLELPSIHQPTSGTGGRCAPLFSCKCVQIQNIVHQRGSPSLLRRFALAFLLFPWERCFPFKCYLSVSFKTSAFLLTNSLEERLSSAHWTSFLAIRDREKEREMFCRWLPQTSLLMSYFFPTSQRMSYSIVGSKVCSLPLLPFLWVYTGALPASTHSSVF